MKHTYILSMTVISILCSGCRPRTAPVERDHPKRRAVVKRKIAGDVIADAAASQIGVTVTYAPAYVALKYPGGDVPMDRGVCSDVVIRALRKVGMDLQKEIHEDMTANFGSYPKIWGLTRPDKNIDHRRVPNMEAYFKRKGMSLGVSRNGPDYRPGDVVTWRISGLPHTGIVSNDLVPGTDRPKVIHNVGSGVVNQDCLFSYKLFGHYRPFPKPRRR